MYLSCLHFESGKRKAEERVTQHAILERSRWREIDSVEGSCVAEEDPHLRLRTSA